MKPASEFQHQAAFVHWFKLQYPGTLLYAIPNGAYLAGDGPMRARRMQKLKAEGLFPGIPDICIPAWHLYVEMKREKGGVVSDAQRDAQAALRAAGYITIIARGFEDAKAQVAACAPVRPKEANA